MAHKTLSLANLPDIDSGRIELAFNAAVRRVIEDITDRPNEKKDRKIELICLVSPDLDVDTGYIQGSHVQFQVKDSVPKRQTTIYPMKLGGNGLLFEPESPANPNQIPLSDANTEKQ